MGTAFVDDHQAFFDMCQQAAGPRLLPSRAPGSSNSCTSAKVLDEELLNAQTNEAGGNSGVDDQSTDNAGQVILLTIVRAWCV